MPILLRNAIPALFHPVSAAELLELVEEERFYSHSTGRWRYMNSSPEKKHDVEKCLYYAAAEVLTRRAVTYIDIGSMFRQQQSS